MENKEKQAYTYLVAAEGGMWFLEQAGSLDELLEKDGLMDHLIESDKAFIVFPLFTHGMSCVDDTPQLFLPDLDDLSHGAALQFIDRMLKGELLGHCVTGEMLSLYDAYVNGQGDPPED